MLMGIDLYERFTQDVTYGIITPNEARVRCGFDPLPSEDILLTERSTAITNCVNCGAVIDLTVDHCEYCGTSHVLMGITRAPKKMPRQRQVHTNYYREAELEFEQLRLENELLKAKTKVLSDSEQIKKLYLYGEAIKAMRSYGRQY